MPVFIQRRMRVPDSMHVWCYIFIDLSTVILFQITDVMMRSLFFFLQGRLIDFASTVAFVLAFLPVSPLIHFPNFRDYFFSTKPYCYQIPRQKMTMLHLSLLFQVVSGHLQCKYQILEIIISIVRLQRFATYFPMNIEMIIIGEIFSKDSKLFWLLLLFLLFLC